ncbi:cellulose biosynthesis protein BcsN [Aureimonas mangrovi]|uniref:cellulose biosynthesis protein BcsN n=1 Tax=Aureimonas mangrovi TaxID=2758041 RepID=UPI00163DCAF8|nr:cellulose biosynthesis protein BcsN [Aureimonas mangrovi]
MNTALSSLLAACVFLSGCMTGAQPISTSRTRTVMLEDTYIAPPVGGPQILEVTERRYPNATEQTILLGNRSRVPGSNFIEVRFFGPVGNSGTGRTPLPNRPLSNTNLIAEMREVLPSVPMRQSALYVQNRYGPFGYAAGRAAGGDTCVYAWQRIAGVDHSTLLMRDKGTIEIRFRLCDSEVDEERLLYTMYGFTIRAFFSDLLWNPYGAPNAVDEQLGSTGAPVMPTGARGFENTAPVAAPVRRAAPARAPAAPEPAPTEAPPLPAPVGPLVPPPPLAAAVVDSPAAATIEVPSPPACEGTQTC